MTSTWDIFEPVQMDDGVGPDISAWTRGLWYTWSAPARAILHSFAEAASRLPEPSQRRAAGAGIYAVTFELGPCDALDPRLERGLSELAHALRRFVLPAEGLVLLSRMFDQRIEGQIIHLLFARLRHILARDDPTSNALYVPIEGCSVLRSWFPPHADLFPGSTLLTVFDDVPRDGSGAALLVSFSTFEDMLDKVDAIPDAVRARVGDIRSERGVERYDEFIDLLYRPDRPWREALLEALAEVQLRLPFTPGQGYLLDDRSWLHGRELQSRPVSIERARRLVFTPLETACGT